MELFIRARLFIKDLAEKPHSLWGSKSPSALRPAANSWVDTGYDPTIQHCSLDLAD